MSGPAAFDGVCATYTFSSTGTILLIAVAGEASNRRGCHPIYGILRTAISDRIASEQPSGLVFDFSHLHYEWGDDMAALIGSWALPVAVVVSPSNAAALGTLVQDELFSDIEEWLFESLGSAVAAVKGRGSGDAA